MRRRTFLKGSAAAVGGAVALGFDLKNARAEMRELKIARHVKDTRERTLVEKNAKGEVVNRTPGLAWIGGCTDTNEFNFLQWKALTAWGVPYRDSQARV